MYYNETIRFKGNQTNGVVGPGIRLGMEIVNTYH